MFRQMKIKMTAYYSAILTAIVLLINVSTFLSINQFNQFQLEADTLRDIQSIAPSEWVVSDSSDGQKSSGTLSETEPHSTDDNAFEESEEISEHQETNDTTKQPMVLKTPDALKTFSVYYIFSNEDKLLKYNVKNSEVNKILMAEYLKTTDSTKPKMVEIKGDKELYLMMVKQSIQFEGRDIGVVYAGRDVTGVENMLHNLIKIMGISSAIGIILSVIIGYFLAGKSTKALKESFEMKQKFIADASHELRTPLSVMKLSAEVIMRETEDEESLVFQVSKDLEEEVDRMLYLVENLLILSRTDSGRLVLNRETILLKTLLMKANFALETLASEKNIHLSYEELVGGVFETISVDSRLMQSVIIILVENAIKYTPEGGLVILRNNGGSSFSIIDNGKGIPIADQKKVFDRFYRVDASRSKNTGGTGLGLSIAKEIVEKHGGKITLISVPENGSEFTVKI